MSSIYIILFLVAVTVIFYKFPGILPQSWRIRSGQDAMNHIFRLQPGEQIVHQTTGIFDPNSHLTIADSMVKNVGLGMVGKQLTGFQTIFFALTDQDRFIISHDPRVEPVAFTKKNLPTIIDTGRQAKRFVKNAAMHRYPGESGERRILEIDSPDLPEFLFPENTGKFEVNTPIEFIPTLIDWMKKNQQKKEF